MFHLLDIRIFDRNVHIAKLVGANKEYIQKKIPYLSKFIVADENEFLDHSDVFIVVNKEDEYCRILDRVPGDKIIYDLVNIDFGKKKTTPNYMGIAW